MSGQRYRSVSSTWINVVVCIFCLTRDVSSSEKVGNTLGSRKTRWIWMATIAVLTHWFKPSRYATHALLSCLGAGVCCQFFWRLTPSDPLLATVTILAEFFDNLKLLDYISDGSYIPLHFSVWKLSESNS